MADIELERAIRALRETYEKAKELKFVRHPLAYAFYRVWKIVDKGGRVKWR